MQGGEASPSGGDQLAVVVANECVYVAGDAQGGGEVNRVQRPQARLAKGARFHKEVLVQPNQIEVGEHLARRAQQRSRRLLPAAARDTSHCAGELRQGELAGQQPFVFENDRRERIALSLFDDQLDECRGIGVEREA